MPCDAPLAVSVFWSLAQVTPGYLFTNRTLIHSDNPRPATRVPLGTGRGYGSTGSRRLINRHRSGEVKASIIYVLYGPVLRVLTVDTEACAPTTVSVPITIPVTATTMAVLIIFISALEHHAQVNQLSETSQLFAYRDMHTHRPLINQIENPGQGWGSCMCSWPGTFAGARHKDQFLCSNISSSVSPLTS
jgi:hypothetical protein